MQVGLNYEIKKNKVPQVKVGLLHKMGPTNLYGLSKTGPTFRIILNHGFK